MLKISKKNILELMEKTNLKNISDPIKRIHATKELIKNGTVNLDNINISGKNINVSYIHLSTLECCELTFTTRSGLSNTYIVSDILGVQTDFEFEDALNVQRELELLLEFGY